MPKIHTQLKVLINKKLQLGLENKIVLKLVISFSTVATSQTQTLTENKSL